MRGPETWGSAAPGALSCSGATALGWHPGVICSYRDSLAHVPRLESPGLLCSLPQTCLHSAGCWVALPSGLAVGGNPEPGR